MKIAIGNDHAAPELKNVIKAHLEERGIEVIDFGVAVGEKADYPVQAEKVAKAVVNKEADLGIAICGSGIGISIACNKVKGIRAACCSDPYSAKLSRIHNNSNVLCFGARVVGDEVAKMMVDCWLDAEFEGGRHQRRIDLITDLENRA